ncbi:PE family protein [Mycobacterium sp.]|uniref:PE family protein n=1 Tax=Mycobacterium sp. TaxID=1785 RepID=UPI002CF985D2|nr:PE family protein [Mycobacterium sp.]
MSFVTTAPYIVTAAAADLAKIGSAVSAANSAALAKTTGVLPAAADEVSVQIAALFDSYASGYREITT